MANEIIFPIKAFTDNYIWVIAHPSTKAVWVVDPGEAIPVLNYLKANKLSLEGILITHHHFDHRGGVLELLESYSVPVIGPKHKDIPANKIVAEGDKIYLSECDLTLDVIAIPGHTLEHIAYYSREQNLLFCGDTLFSAGCGRVFEGTYAQMYQSLMKLKALPNETKIYCAHEYTEANLAFAKHLEPNNPEVIKKASEVKALRENDTITLPSILELEKKINPFLRCEYRTIAEAAEKHCGSSLSTPELVFSIIREWKNQYS